MNGKKIVVAYDGSPDSNKALKLGAEMAQALSAEIKLVTVVEPLPALYNEARNFEALDLAIKEIGEIHIEAGMKLAEELGVKVTTDTLKGNTADEIIRFAEAENAGLIVVGTRGLGGFQRLLLGSVAHALVTHSHIPVLVAK
jgi:nucleotide-binding universal stress UspA family protein